MTFQSLLAIVVIGIVGVSTTCAEAPQITKLVPAEGSPGETIKILGDHLKKTKSVMFIVGFIRRPVKFRPVSENELEVDVPEFYRPDAEAIIVVQNDDGVAVTCPPGEIVLRTNGLPGEKPYPKAQAHFLHVLAGGAVDHTRIITVVEDGGIVNSVKDSPLVLVKNGGIVGQAERRWAHAHPVVVMHEPQARLGNHFSNPETECLVSRVKEIRVSEGIGPFVFRPAPLADELKAAKEIPKIASIKPLTVTPGDAITLKGTGFSGTTDVYVVLGRKAKKSGFRIVSDTELTLETPELRDSDHGEVVVINALGLTMTRSPAPPAKEPKPHREAANSQQMFHVKSDMVLNRSEVGKLSQHTLYLVDGGGIIAERCVGFFLVKHGGTVIDGDGDMFYEPGVVLSPRRTQPGRYELTVQVPKIELSPVKQGLKFSDFAAHKQPKKKKK